MVLQMDFYVLTLFPDMISQGMGNSITGRAADNGLIHVVPVNIRDYTSDKHGKVDDYTYGGGAGMLMQAQPVYDAWKSVGEQIQAKKTRGDVRPRTIYVTPQGKPFTQQMAEEFARQPNLVFLCGHYEGIDERVLEETVTDYVSIGDYVLTGGELPAMVMIDAISRLVPGVLNNDASAETESFHNDLLEYPQYSRPETWHEKTVPRILLSGNHRKILQWRLEQSIERTARIRPDLYRRYEEKQNLITLLERRKRNHIQMIEVLNRGNGEILFASGADILIKDRKSGACLLSAADAEAGRKLLALIPKETKLFVTSQEFLNILLEEQFGARVMFRCLQACYTRREALPVRHKDIRLLGEEHADYICANYHCGDKDYVLGRLREKTMHGAFVEDHLAGFIGIHDDGGIGLLFVDGNYRRQGIGASLEAFMINKRKELGEIPYVQVVSDNQNSLRMQERLGLNLSTEAIWWLDRN